MKDDENSALNIMQNNFKDELVKYATVPDEFDEYVGGMAETSALGKSGEFNKAQQHIINEIYDKIESAEVLPGILQQFIDSIGEIRWGIIKEHDIKDTKTILMATREFSGYYADAIIRKICNHGYREVELRVDDVYDNLASYIDNKNDHMFRIDIFGHLGKMCGIYLKNVDVRLMGNTEDAFGANAENSRFIVKGNMGGRFARTAKRSTFVIDGEISSYGSGLYARDSTFISNSKEDFAIISKNSDKGCVISFMEEAGVLK